MSSTMYYKVSKDTVVYAMSAHNKPVVTVDAPARIQFETWDCFSGQIQLDNAKFDGVDWNCINPATGPVYINGAEEGDILAVTIDKIETAEAGIVVCGKGVSVAGDSLQRSIKVVPVKNNTALFSERLHLPLTKMIGVIGTAPKSGEVSCATPDMHGGNMDCKEIKEGATLLLPVNVPGALLAMGDLHAVMADGEVGGSGLEISGCITVSVKVIKGITAPLPMLFNNTHVMTIASDEDLDKAVDLAVSNMVTYLSSAGSFTREEAIMLCSLVADARICQVVDPKKTIRVELAKKYLPEGINLVF